MEVNIDGVNYLVDSYDSKIINILLEDGRISFSDLAIQVGLSRANVTSRIHRLQEIGLIEKFTVNTHFTYLRKNIAVYFDIKVQPVALERTAKEISNFSDIVVVYQMTGGSMLHVHGFFNDIKDISEFLNTHVFQLEGVEDVRTEFILKKFKSDFV